MNFLKSGVGQICSRLIIFNNFTRNMSKTAIILLAEGSEEMEAVIPADTLRRAGVKVTIAGISGPNVVTCRSETKIEPDDSLENALKNGPYDVVILPGGLIGSQNLCESSAVGNLIQKQEAEGRLIAAICAAPTVLKRYGVATGKKVTTYPSAQNQMEGYVYSEDRVVIDGNLITSRGPGTALEFSLAIVGKLLNQEAVETLNNAMLNKI